VKRRINTQARHEWKKVEVITKVDKNVSKNETAKAYGKPLSNRSAYLKYRDSTEQQASHGCNILKCIKIHGSKHDNMEQTCS
jgi:hypothetical protein